MWWGHAAVLGDVAWPDTEREDKADVWHNHLTLPVSSSMFQPRPSLTGIGSPWRWALFVFKHLPAGVINLLAMVVIPFIFSFCFFPSIMLSPLMVFPPALELPFPNM